MEKKMAIGLALAILIMLIAGPAEAEVYTLWAGQHIDVGTVTIENDSDTLYVIYETSGGWELIETHVHASIDPSQIPQTQPNKKGKGGENPIPGAFQFSELPSDPTIQIYEINLSEIGDSGFDPEGCDDLFVAAHAEVTHVDDVQEESAWTGDLDFPGANWATYCRYISQSSCDGIPVYLFITHPEPVPPLEIPEVDGFLLLQCDCGDIGKSSGDYPCYFDCEKYTILSNVDVKLKPRLSRLCHVDVKWNAYINGSNIIPGDGQEHEFEVCIKVWKVEIEGVEHGDVMQIGCLNISVEPDDS